MRDKYFTTRFNNIVSLLLALIVALVFIIVLSGAVGEPASATAASFTALVAIGGAI